MALNPLMRYDEGDTVWLCLNGEPDRFRVLDQRHVGDHAELHLGSEHSDADAIVATWDGPADTGTIVARDGSENALWEADIQDAAPAKRMLMQAGVDDLLKRGLSPTQALAYWHVVIMGTPQDERAAVRGTTQQAISDALVKAEEKLA